MTELVCPRGHLSDDPDFCSECGLRIAAPAAPAAVPPLVQAAPSGEPCPDCGTPRAPGARFCEVCRHDFAAGAGAALAPPASPAAPAAPASPPPAAAPPPPAPPLPDLLAAAPSGNVWVVVSRDSARLAAEGGAPEPDRAYPLDLAENLVGRRGGRRDLHPEVPVADPSVSARHLKICRRPDGALYGVDVGSSNGTLLNGQPLSEGVEAPLAPGDRLEIGAYTTLRLEAR